MLEKYDVIAWAHWLRAGGCQKIYGLGESLGAAILIQATAVEPIFDAIVAECPYANLRRMAEYRIRGMLKSVPLAVSSPIATVVTDAGLLYARTFEKLDFAQVSPAHSIAASTTPVLLIHGLEEITRLPPNLRSFTLPALGIPSCGSFHTPITRKHPQSHPWNFTIES